MLNKYSLHRNDRGQSLVQVVVSVGILGILMAAMAVSMSTQIKETKALTEKIASNDLKRILTATLSSNACSLFITKPGNVAAGSSLTFDRNSVPVTINLNSVPASTTDGSNIVSLANPVASALSSSLRLRASSGIQLQVTTPTTGSLLVNFEQNQLVRQIANLSFPLLLTTTTSGSNVTITGCQLPSASAGGDWRCNVKHDLHRVYCFRVTDGHFCEARDTTNYAWACAPKAGWPGPADWDCSGADQDIGCVDRATGKICATESGSAWTCFAGSGWTP